jgi:Tfp pilus assembly protein PilF
LFSGLIALGLLVVFCAASARAWQYIALNKELALARRSLREFQPEEAVERLTRLTAQRPDCAEAEFLLACAYRRARQLDQVRPHLLRAQELGWDQDEIDRQFCLTFFQAGDFRRSADEMTDRLREEASDDEAEETYEALARGYISALLLRQANFLIDGWLKWRPQSAAARLLQADVANLAGENELELECYRQAVDADPSNYEARLRLAHAVLEATDIDWAKELFEGCLRERPGDPDVLLGLAECHQRRGETEEAQKLIELTLAANPSPSRRSAALTLAGQMAIEARDYALASRRLEESVEVLPGNLPSVYYKLVQALTRCGRDDEAKAYNERFQQLMKMERRLEDLHAEVLREPENADLRMEIGEIMLEYGSTKAGVNWLLSALLYDPQHIGVNRRLAEHYEHEGDTKLAAAHRAVVARASGEVPSTPIVIAPPADKVDGAASPSPPTGEGAP